MDKQMIEQEILITLTRLLAEQLGVPADNVTRSAKLVADLGADSLDIIELVMAVEEEFDVEFSDEEVERLATVADVLSLIQRKAGYQPAVQE